MISPPANRSSEWLDPDHWITSLMNNEFGPDYAVDPQKDDKTVVIRYRKELESQLKVWPGSANGEIRSIEQHLDEKDQEVLATEFEMTFPQNGRWAFRVDFRTDYGMYNKFPSRVTFDTLGPELVLRELHKEADRAGHDDLSKRFGQFERQRLDYYDLLVMSHPAFHCTSYLDKATEWPDLSDTTQHHEFIGGSPADINAFLLQNGAWRKSFNVEIPSVRPASQWVRKLHGDSGD